MGSYSTHCVQEVSFSCGLFQDLPQQTEASTIHHKAGSQGRTVVLIAHLSAKPMTAGVALSSAISGMKGWGSHMETSLCPGFCPGLGKEATPTTGDQGQALCHRYELGLAYQAPSFPTLLLHSPGLGTLRVPLLPCSHGLLAGPRHQVSHECPTLGLDSLSHFH